MMVSILLVEDDCDVRDYFEEVLSEVLPSIEAVHTENGEDALRLLSERDFDVIILDNRMPVTTGIEVFKEIRAEASGRNFATPIIVVSGYIEEFSNELPKSDPFVWLAEKPIKEKSLRNLVLIALKAKGKI